MGKDIHIWLGEYLKDLAIQSDRPKAGLPVKIYFTLADHFEPYCEGAEREMARSRVQSWCLRWPEIAAQYKDYSGNSPKHSFFYPLEEYDPDILDQLASICRKGWGNVEIHLHHDNDTSGSLRQKLNEYKILLYQRHGLLRKNTHTGEVVYGFIHGNWALDNSRRDGRWCGVNDELTILKETGCYADFTLPSAPGDTQTKTINRIYYAKDNPLKPKSHNTGINVAVGRDCGGNLMIIQGPLSLNWKNRKYGIFPRIENGDLCFDNPVTDERVRLWVKYAPRIEGAPNDIFLKIYTHGCQDDNLRYLLIDHGLETLYDILCKKYSDGDNYQLFFVTPYEMYEKIKCLEGNNAGIVSNDL